MKKRIVGTAKKFCGNDPMKQHQMDRSRVLYIREGVERLDIVEV